MALKQITVWGKNRPGNLAKITGAVAAAGVNISGLFASDARGRSPVRLLVANARRATAALRKAGYRVTQEPVVILNLADKPGRLARAATKLAARGINIGYGYATVGGGAKSARIVLGAKNAAAAKRALR